MTMASGFSTDWYPINLPELISCHTLTHRVVVSLTSMFFPINRYTSIWGPSHLLVLYPEHCLLVAPSPHTSFASYVKSEPGPTTLLTPYNIISLIFTMQHSWFPPKRLMPSNTITSMPAIFSIHCLDYPTKLQTPQRKEVCFNLLNADSASSNMYWM